MAGTQPIRVGFKELLATVMMVKDEADIIRESIERALHLFDFALVVDHGSEDGTRQLLNEYSKSVGRRTLAIWHYNSEPYFQSEIVTALAKEAFRRGAHWVAPLDADEFLLFDSRASFRNRLTEFSDDVVHFRWVNTVPELTGGRTTLPPKLDQTVLLAPNPPVAVPRVKICLRRSFARKHRWFLIGQGSHRAHRHRHDGGLVGNCAGELIHLPFRSREQALRKLSAASFAEAAHHSDNVRIGSHIARISQSGHFSDIAETTDRHLMARAVLEYEHRSVRGTEVKFSREIRLPTVPTLFSSPQNSPEDLWRHGHFDTRGSVREPHQICFSTKEPEVLLRPNSILEARKKSAGKVWLAIVVSRAYRARDALWALRK